MRTISFEAIPEEKYGYSFQRGIMNVMIAAPDENLDEFFRNDEELASADLAYNNGDYEYYAKLIYACAMRGNLYAQNYLAMAYRDGDGLPSDEHKAFVWFRNAAENGLLDAQYNVSLCYLNGTGCDVDIDKAIFYTKHAADNGHLDAQFNMGAFYYNGDIVSKDISKAVYYMEQAANRGFEPAIDFLNEL